VHPFVRFTEKLGRGVPDRAVWINNFATTDAQRALLAVLNGADEIGRPFIMSRQVPAERLAILRKAFSDTMRDQAFLADMDKLGHPVLPLAGEEAEKIVARMSGASPEVLKRARTIYE
jgi:hypothetical protein